MESEEWRDISGWPGYQVSSLGQVRSFKGINGAMPRTRKPRRLKLQAGDRPGFTRYLSCGLSAPGRRRRVYVHVIMAAAFLGPRPEGMQVCHNNGDSLDNRLENLRYDTPHNNQADRLKHGTSNRGEGNGRAKLTPAEIAAIRSVPRMVKTSSLSRAYDISKPTMAAIRSGATWKDV